MSLVAYADSGDDSSDNESSEDVLPSGSGQKCVSNNEDQVEEPVHFTGSILGQYSVVHVTSLNSTKAVYFVTSAYSRG